MPDPTARGEAGAGHAEHPGHTSEAGAGGRQGQD